MQLKDLEKRNFLFYLNTVKHLTFEDSLIGELADPSSWEDLVELIRSARVKDGFVSTIRKAQIYVHIPFCGRICKFCACSKSLLRQRSEIDTYIETLKYQMQKLSPAFHGLNGDSICFGGGTPSILDVKQMNAILDEVDKHFPNKNRRIIYEINPSSWTPSKLEMLSSRGLFRLSIGVQSLNEQVLKNVARSQTKAKVLWCIRSALKRQVPHINVDLIAGLPGQTVKSFIEDLNILIREGATIVHIYPYCGSSLEMLRDLGETVQDFFKRRDTMMRSADQILRKAGLKRKGYEAFTKDGTGEEDQEKVYLNLESAIAAFGSSARGQFPGAAFYHIDEKKPFNSDTNLTVCAQDVGYVMSHYAVFAIMHGLDQKMFYKRFGVSLDQHCGEGLRFLQRSGLITCSQGVWKYSGKWEISRLYEFLSLSRVLFSEELLARLRSRLQGRYNPEHDYSKGHSLLRMYGDEWLMNLYYNLGF